MSSDLQCQRCPKTYPWRGSRDTTQAAARFAGWRVFDGKSETGAQLNVVLCPKDSGEPRERVSKLVPLDGQESFDLDL